MSYLVQLGTYNPLLDTFTPVLDCNDGTTLELADRDGLVMPPPALDLYAAANPRLPGQRITAQNYGSRSIRLTLAAGPLATYAALQAVLQTLYTLQEQTRLARQSVQSGYLATPRVALLIQLPGATTPLYADVLGMAHDLPSVGDTQSWVRLWHEGIGVDLLCAPHLRGTRQTVQNLLMNPGFEQPAPGGFTAYRDQLATANSLTTLSGTAPVQGLATYADAVQADTPLRFYRLDETSGTVATDAANAQNGTYIGGYTLGVTGALTGDSDTAITLNGTTGYVAMSVAALMIAGNGPFSHEVWVKFAAIPASTQIFFHAGGSGTANNSFQMYLASTGKVSAGFFGLAGISSNAALSTATWHHIVSTWDGTTQLLYVDGVAQTATTTPGAANQSATFYQIGAQNNAGTIANFWSGQLDEVATYASTLSPARILAHYTAGTTTPAAAATTQQIVAGSRVSLGSPAWASLIQWQSRFRWATGLTATFALHSPNASNSLAVVVTSTTISYVHTVAGVAHVLASAAIAPVNGIWYWVHATQFPALPGNAPQVYVNFLSDQQGVFGNILTFLGPVPTFDAVTALSGPVVFAASGANLTLSTQKMTLFGPGSWALSSTGTGPVVGAWEQQTTNTYPSGAVQSSGALRLDLAPLGTTVAVVSSTPNTTSLIPVSTGQRLSLAILVKAPAISNTATVTLSANEYDSTGTTLLRTSGTLATLTGPQASYTVLSASYLVGITTALAQLVVTVTDSAASGGATVWLDNAQAWTTGAATMPYAELCFAASPAQLLLTGLLGDVPAPCHLAVGILPSGGSLPASGSLTLYLGRRAIAGYAAVLVGASYIGGSDGTTMKAVLDITGWGGYHVESHTGAASYQAFFLSSLTRDLVGAFHLVTRQRILDTPASSQNLYPLSYQVQNAWAGNGTRLDRLGLLQGTPVFPFTGATWQLADAGLVLIPSYAVGTLTDGGQLWTTLATQNSTASTELDTDWGALLPVDGDLLAATFQNNAAGQSLAGWVYVYFDGLSVLNAGQGATNWSLEPQRVPRPSHAGGGPGLVTSATPSLVSVGDTLPRVDPAAATTAASGVNQFLVIATDANAVNLPVAIQISYAPLYLQPR